MLNGVKVSNDEELVREDPSHVSPCDETCSHGHCDYHPYLLQTAVV